MKILRSLNQGHPSPFLMNVQVSLLQGSSQSFQRILPYSSSWFFGASWAASSRELTLLRGFKLGLLSWGLLEGWWRWLLLLSTKRSFSILQSWISVAVSGGWLVYRAIQILEIILSWRHCVPVIARSHCEILESGLSLLLGEAFMISSICSLRGGLFCTKEWWLLILELRAFACTSWGKCRQLMLSHHRIFSQGSLQ